LIVHTKRRCVAKTAWEKAFTFEKLDSRGLIPPLALSGD
jgi:hypothetical protein